MTFNDHSRLRGQHAFLSASKYNWINYDPDKLAVVYTNFMATQKGTELSLQQSASSSAKSFPVQRKP